MKSSDFKLRKQSVKKNTGAVKRFHFEDSPLRLVIFQLEFKSDNLYLGISEKVNCRQFKPSAMLLGCLHSKLKITLKNTAAIY